MKHLISLVIQEKIEEYVGEGITTAAGVPILPGQEKPWGIIISNFSILQLHPGRRVNEALADTSKANETLKQTNLATKGEATKIVKVGDASAKAKTAMGNAEAAAAKAVAAVLKDNPDAVRARELDVVETGFKNANLIMANSVLDVIAAENLLKKKETK
jgi:regulator of protease activity HflC (stomatin/prohibitin superfamily)